MTRSRRSVRARFLTIALALATLPGVIVVAAPAGTAGADVCASAGRRITVGGCL